MYVALEGIDTAGKSTQIARLRDHFGDAVITKEPGGTRPGEQIRELLLHGGLQSSKAEFLLFLADRAEHMEQIVKPNMDRLVISDRSVISGIAYALVRDELAQTAILHLNRFATDGIYPQKVILLQLSKEELSHRLSLKKLDGIESRGVEYLLGIQDALIEACGLLGVALTIIDASKSIEAITQEIIHTIKESL